MLEGPCFPEYIHPVLTAAHGVSFPQGRPLEVALVLHSTLFTSHRQEIRALAQAGTVSLLSEYREFKFLFPVSFVD